jgi:hypothetical protein
MSGCRRPQLADMAARARAHGRGGAGVTGLAGLPRLASRHARPHAGVGPTAPIGPLHIILGPFGHA